MRPGPRSAPSVSAATPRTGTSTAPSRPSSGPASRRIQPSPARTGVADNRRIAMTLTMLCIAAAMIGVAAIGAAHAQDKTIVTLGTATPGGGFPVYGDAVAQTINDTDATLLVQPRNTKGSAENIP